MKITYYLNNIAVSDVSRPITIRNILSYFKQYESDSSSPGYKDSLSRFLHIPPEYDYKTIEPEGLGLDCLAPCPVCGDEPHYEDPDFIYPVQIDFATGERKMWVAGCCKHGCGCGFAYYAPTREDALRKWNRGYFEKRFDDPVYHRVDKMLDEIKASIPWQQRFRMAGLRITPMLMIIMSIVNDYLSGNCDIANNDQGLIDLWVEATNDGTIENHVYSGVDYHPCNPTQLLEYMYHSMWEWVSVSYEQA